MLIHQCLNQSGIHFSIDIEKLHKNEDPLSLIGAAQQFERQSLGFQNIYSLLQYYQSQRKQIPPAMHEGIVQCQLRLADQFQHFISQADVGRFIQLLIQSSDNHLKQLGQQLLLQRQSQLETISQAQLHVAKANVYAQLSNRALHLENLAKVCQLEPDSKITTLKSDAISTAPSFNLSHYLKKQEDQECRRKIWQAYQVRAKHFSEPVLKQIVDLRQRQAHQAGFNSYARFLLRNNYLNTPEKVKAFLDSQTKQLSFSPWDLNQTLTQARALSNTRTQHQEPAFRLDTQTLVEISQNILTPFGIILEPVSSSQVHVWHHDRFLGAIFLHQGTSFQSTELKASIVGHQFGQSELSFKGKVKHLRDRKKLAQALANTIVTLANGQRHYFNTQFSFNADMAQLPQKWLALYIDNQLSHLMPFQQDLAYQNMIDNYRKQTHIFRAKAALTLFEDKDNPSYKDLATEFNASYQGNWSGAKNIVYNSKAILNQESNYYYSLWQDALAKALIKHAVVSPEAIFSLLIINEKGLTTAQRLARVFAQEPSFTALLSLLKQDDN